MITAFIVAVGILLAGAGIALAFGAMALDMQGGGLLSLKTLPFWAIAAVGVAVAAIPFL